MAYEDMRRQTLLGNVANNMIAMGNRTAATSPAEAIQQLQMREQAKKRATLQDTLAMRQEDRLRLKQSRDAEALKTEAAREQQRRDIYAGNQGQPLVEALQGAGFPGEAGQVYSTQPKPVIPKEQLSLGFRTYLKSHNAEASPESYEAWQKDEREKAAAGGPAGERWSRINQDFMKDFSTTKANVLQTRVSYEAMLDSEKALNSGEFISGTAANWKLKFAKLANLAGANNDELITNTETYAKSMGRQTAEIIKAFGAGTGLSDADREYAEGISGGTISLNKNTMKRLTTLAKKYYKMGVDDYNSQAKLIKGKDTEGRLFMDLSPIELNSRGTTPPPAAGGWSMRKL